MDVQPIQNSLQQQKKLSMFLVDIQCQQFMHFIKSWKRLYEKVLRIFIRTREKYD